MTPQRPHAAALTRELCVSHVLAMRLAGEANRLLTQTDDSGRRDPERAGVEGARLASVVARLMGLYQRGFLRLCSSAGADGRNVAAPCVQAAAEGPRHDATGEGAR